LYDGEIRQTDEDLGVFLRYLSESGLMKKTVIIIMGEHGEQFYEHGNTSHHGLYDEMIRIPMAMHLPDSESVEYGKLVSQVDVLPTVLDIIGVYGSVPDGSRGVSLKRLVSNDESRGWVYAEYSGGAMPSCSALRSERYKVIQYEGSVEVYDLINDGQEQRPLKESQYNNQINNLIDSLSNFKNTSTSKISKSKDQHTGS